MTPSNLRKQPLSVLQDIIDTYTHCVFNVEYFSNRESRWKKRKFSKKVLENKRKKVARNVQLLDLYVRRLKTYKQVSEEVGGRSPSGIKSSLDRVLRIYEWEKQMKGKNNV
jgi:hypothetical protein